MAKEKPARKPSPAALTDAPWSVLDPLMAAAQAQRGGRPREVALREVVKTIVSLNRRGGQWERLPHA